MKKRTRKFLESIAWLSLLVEAVLIITTFDHGSSWVTKVGVGFFGSLFIVLAAYLYIHKQDEEKEARQKQKEDEDELRRIIDAFLANISMETDRMAHMLTEAITKKKDDEPYLFAKVQSMTLKEIHELVIKMVFLPRDLDLLLDLIMIPGKRSVRVAFRIRNAVQFLQSMQPISYVPRCPPEMKAFLKEYLTDNEKAFDDWMNRV
jgi:hypothetical protein